jgi:hypothetical protein
MTKPIQLHVGYVGITREGKRVEITAKDTRDTDYPWKTEEDAWYLNSGHYWQHKRCSKYDIVGPWQVAVETPVEPLADYNDGKWHRWAGGDRPVHPNTLVYATYIDQDDGVITDSRYARNYHWDSGHGPIVAFRVTKEYVEPPKEPREFWIYHGITSDVKTEKPSDMYGYIHVREVLTDD